METFKRDATPVMNTGSFDTVAQILRLEDSNANTPLPGTLCFLKKYVLSDTTHHQKYEEVISRFEEKETLNTFIRGNDRIRIIKLKKEGKAD